MADFFPSLTATMCKYSFIAYAYPIGTGPKLMKGILGELLNSKAIGLPPQELLWAGVTDKLPPGITESDSDGLIDWNVALVYVCREANSNDYTVVVRGTNPFSLPSWEYEDLDAGSKVAWQSESSPGTDCGSISKATSTALTTHLGLLDGGKTLFAYLDEHRSSMTSLRFTGHSLGGCVSPVLALKYKEHLDAQGITVPKLSLYSYAGPTPGDTNFAEYMKTSFADFSEVSFLRDEKDIVPHVWDLKDMSEISNLYTFCHTTSTIDSILTHFENLVQGLDYQHAIPGFQPLILEDIFQRLFGLETLKSAVHDVKLKPLIASATVSLARNGITVSGKDDAECVRTILWFLIAMCMHVAPYLVLCGDEAQAELLDKVIKPHYFQGILG